MHACIHKMEAIWTVSTCLHTYIHTQDGSYMDCERAGMENFYGEINIAGKKALKRDKFNPDGDQVRC